MNRHRMFPGGLRAQLLLGLCLLLVGTFAPILVTVESVMARQVTDSEIRRAQAVAAVAERAIANGASAESLLVAPIVGIATEDGVCVGEACDQLASTTAPSQRLTWNGSLYVAVARANDVRVALALPGLESRLDQTRGVLWPFFLIDAIFVLALGYAFFTYLVVRPLRSIGVATTRASEGDFASPIERLPRNEFGQVGRSFNRMLDRIEAGTEALESKVEEIQEANRRLASTQASLIRSEKLASVGQLAAGIAHEVGNPLAALSGYAELLGDADLDDDERLEIADRMTRQLERIREIIRNLLDFSRSDEEAERIATELRAVAADAVALVEAMPRARNKEIVIGGEGRATTVPTQLVQVLLNLLMNAVDAYGEAAGEIRVEIESQETTVSMKVIDRGPGIAEGDLLRIFDPFYTTKEPGEGTGLGLAICQRMVDDLGGSLTLESTPESGTTFTVTLPRSPETE